MFFIFIMILQWEHIKTIYFTALTINPVPDS